jgi:hypothetical protein
MEPFAASTDVTLPFVAANAKDATRHSDSTTTTMIESFLIFIPS